MVSDCCNARLVDGWATNLCSECFEHCDIADVTSDTNLGDVIITLESLMKRLHESGINDVEELPRIIDEIRKIQKQMYLMGNLIKQTQEE